MTKFLTWCTGIILLITLMGCGNLPNANAEERLFLDISLDFLGEYDLPKQTFQETRVGGLSGLTYDRQRDRFYAISDDRNQPRFYTLKLDLKPLPQTGIEKITVENVTLLKDESGQVYAPQKLDTEGIALTPRGTVFIASEGDIQKKVLPLIGEFDLKNGQLQQKLRLANRFLPSANPDAPPQGIQNNSGFESLAVAATSILKDDPFRLFSAVENALIQDIDLEKRPKLTPLRFLHYVINPIGEPVLVGENLYVLDPIKAGTLFSGLSDITTLEKEGYFLSLERSLGLAGFEAKLFQVINANATDTSNIKSFKTGTQGIEPLRKKLILDLTSLEIELDNLEGLTFGPRLADGSSTLLLVSDDNFREDQVNQFLLFKVKIS